MRIDRPNLKPNRISYYFVLFFIPIIFTLTSGEVIIWSDNMTDFSINWTVGGTGGPWTKVSNRYNSASYSAKCTPNNNYSINQNNWMQRSVDLSGYVNATVTFQIWQNTWPLDSIYFEYYSGGSWVNYWSRAGNYGGFTQIVLTNIPNTATAIRFRFVSNDVGTTEGVYIDDVCVWGFRYDVGCTQIIAPTAITDSGQSVTPQARVENFGDFAATFIARMRIGTSYNDSVQVTNLPVGNSTVVNFTNWNPLLRGIYAVGCSTELANDINHTNDRTVCSTEVRVRNVGTVSIVAPSGTVDSGQVITPRAVIKNYGTATETFTVYYWITPSYLSSRSRTLSPGAAETTNFDPWTARPRGAQAIRCSTALATDMIKSDDRQTGSVSVRVRDVGTTIIQVPTGYVDSSSAIPLPQANVKNYGTDIETFNVNFQITGPSNWNNTTTVSNLNPNEERTIFFGGWNIGPRGNYTTRCSTALTGDQVSNNNKFDSSFIVRVHDVGATSISSPPAAVDSNSTVSVTATVQNFGTESETFSVLARIGSFYTSTRTVTITAGGSQLITFDNWLVNQARNTYTVNCTTQLASDAKPSNNFSASIVTVNVHDVGVTTILTPTSPVDTNTTSGVTAQIQNYGTYSETFNIVFKIGTFYTSTRSLTLAAGNSSVVTFDNWTVTQPRGTYAMKCSTSLNSDINPNNNYQTGSVSVRVRDVGVATINSPVTADSAATVTVSAQVSNYGNFTETFTVQFQIGSFYTSTRTTTVNPGSSTVVTFDNWTVLQTRGTYATKCSTLLSNDVHQGNDYQNGSVIIRVHDVGATSITSPPAAVDSNSTVSVTATVQNFGTESETFSTVFRISSFYMSSRTVTLAPGDSQLVSFDNWLVSRTRGTYTARCTTTLATDAKPSNNRKTKSITINVHDVGVASIISPTVIVDTNTTTTVSAQIQNYGTYAETLSVVFEISTFYASARSIILAAGTNTNVTFDNWTVTQPRGSYAMKCSTLLNSDINPINNQQTGLITVRVRDIGVVAITSPVTADSAEKAVVSAQITNYGSETETFTVQFRIGSFYISTSTLTLNPNVANLVTFDDWTVLQPRGSYVTKCTTLLTGDIHPENDFQNGSVTVKVHDAGILSIVSPPAAVDSNSTQAIAATIKNYGTESESLAVLFRIGSFYTSSRTANISAGATQIIIFDNWLVNQPRNTYTVKCTTQLAADANPTNNLTTSNVTINVHDVGVATIISPFSVVDTNSLTPVTAQIQNYGTYSETFNINFKIGSFYNSNRSLTLAAGNTSTVTFDTWSVTQMRGSYAIKCSTLLSTDINPINNYQSRSVNVRVRDVGVVAITSPPSIVDTSTKNGVNAQIQNYGTNTETFNVIFKIGSFYTSTRSLTLTAGNTTTATFDTWVVTQPRGVYSTKCSTAYSPDVNKNNDYQIRSVTIRIHDVGVASIDVPALVDTAEIVPIRSVVTNCGTEPETLTAQFRIGSF
jgi:CARDB